MASIVVLIAGMLHAVVLRHDALERLGRLFHSRFYPVDSVRPGDEMNQVMYGYGILTYVEDVIPRLRPACRQTKFSLGDKSTTHTFRGRLVIRGFRQAQAINGIACKRFGWFGSVHEDSLHAEERERCAGHQFGFLISIDEGGKFVLRLAFHPSRQHVLQTIVNRYIRSSVA